MVISWIGEQIKYSCRWDKVLETYYPEWHKVWTDPQKYFEYLHNYWNTLNAVKLIKWEKHIKDNMKILDLGGGTGWLSAYISHFNLSSKIYCLDSCEYFLSNILPEIIKLMEGRSENIIPIEGLFAPLLFENNSLDIVVTSSSLHHADNLELVLKEINRVLKDKGMLFILNETPYVYYIYIYIIMKQWLGIVKKVLIREYKQMSSSISAAGYLYDPYLGDKAYPYWYWLKSIEKSKFKIIEIVKTPYFPSREIKKGNRLTHFICQKRIIDNEESKNGFKKQEGIGDRG